MSFKIGDKVKLKKSQLKFYKEEAFRMNCVSNVLDEKNAEVYYMYMLLGNGYSYKATIVGHSFSNNNYRVEFKFSKDYIYRCYQEPESLIKST